MTATQQASAEVVPSASPKPVASAARIHPDSNQSVAILTPLIVLIGLSAFAISFDGQVGVASWVGLGLFSLLVPIIVDAVIVVFSYFVLLLRARGENQRGAWVIIASSILVSIALNSLDHFLPLIDTPLAKAIVGGCLGALMPLYLLATTHSAIKILVAPPLGTPEQRQAARIAVDLGETKIFENRLTKKKGTPERARALLLLEARLDSGSTVSEIARSESVDRSVIYAAKKEIEANK
jgi:hypothetical protein